VGSIATDWRAGNATVHPCPQSSPPAKLHEGC
jgi:hypothetical protein